MDTTARRRKLQKVVLDSKNDLYPHDINLYREFPQNSIPLSEFEELALERLQLLRLLEQATLKGFKPFSDEWKNSIKEDLVKNNLKKYKRLLGGDPNKYATIFLLLATYVDILLVARVIWIFKPVVPIICPISFYD